MNNKLLILLVLISVFQSLKLKAQINNNNFANAHELVIAKDGYAYDTVRAFVSMQIAGIEKEEVFAPLIENMALDFKSVWFKFTLPTNRSVELRLVQPDTLIEPNHVGLAVYNARVNNYPKRADLTPELPAFAQMGSIKTDYVKAGTYYIQVSARKNVVDSIGIELLTMPINQQGNFAYLPLTNFNNLDLNYYSIDSIGERMPFSNQSNISKVIYQNIQVPAVYDNYWIELEAKEMAIALYEGNLNNHPNTWKLIKKSTFGTEYVNWAFPCNQLNYKKNYIVKLFGNQKSEILHWKDSVLAGSVLIGNGTDPVNDLLNIQLSGFLRNQKSIRNLLFTSVNCANKNALKLCSNYHHLLIRQDTFYHKKANGEILDTLKLEINREAGYWLKLEVHEDLKISGVQLDDLIIFKGIAKNDICELGPPVDLKDKCLHKGEEYTLLYPVNSTMYTNNDTLIEGLVGENVSLNLEFERLDTSGLGVAHYYSYNLAQQLGKVSFPTTQAVFKQKLKDDILLGHDSKFTIANKTYTGCLSFTVFDLEDSAYIGHSFAAKMPSLYQLSADGLLSKAINHELVFRSSAIEGMYSQNVCPPGKYLFVYQDDYQEIGVCNRIDLATASGYLLLRKEFKSVLQQDACSHAHYLPNLALELNNGNAISDDLEIYKYHEFGYYCTSALNSSLLKPSFYNYEQHKNKIGGLFYAVFKLDDSLGVNISTDRGEGFQLLNGDIRTNSSLAKDSTKVLQEFGLKFNKKLYAGYYTLVFATPVDSFLIKIKANSLQPNRNALQSKDLEWLNTTNPTKEVTNEFRCAKNEDSYWYTFQMTEPGEVSLSSNKPFQIYSIYQSTRGNKLSFKQVQALNLVDSTDENLIPIRVGAAVFNEYFFSHNSIDTVRYYLKVEQARTSVCLMSFSFELDFVPDQSGTTKGDSCQNAYSISLIAEDSAVQNASINLHSLGEGPAEQERSKLWPDFVESKFKTTWFKIKAEDAEGMKLSIAELGDTASSAIRIYYGNCKALTPATTIINQKTTITLDCIANSEYYVQMFNPKSIVGYKSISANTTKAFKTCKIIDVEAVFANFKSFGNCFSNGVEFSNLSTQGDDISYVWDFGEGNTSSDFNPIHKYASKSIYDTFLVQLTVLNKVNGRKDSISRKVTVGNFSYNIITDSLACDSHTLTVNPAIYNYTWAKVVRNNTGYKKYFLSNDTVVKVAITDSVTWFTLRADFGECVSRDSFPIYAIKNQSFANRNGLICMGEPGVYIKKPMKDNRYQLVDNYGQYQDSIFVNTTGLHTFKLLKENESCVDTLTVNTKKLYKARRSSNIKCEGNVLLLGFTGEYKTYVIDSLSTEYNQDWYVNKERAWYKFKYRDIDEKCPWFIDSVYIDSFIKPPFYLNDTVLCNDDTLEQDLLYTHATELNGEEIFTEKLKVYDAGSYHFSYHYEVDHCVFTDEFTIQRGEIDQLTLENEILCFESDSLQLQLTNYDSLYWSNGSNDPEQIFSKEGTYWLQAFKNGCVVSDTFTLTNYCEPKLFIPNAFSPNGDADNPVFIAKGDKIQKFQMRIYNRDGALIFYTDDINEGWDGRIKNLDAPMASYYYVVEYSTEQGDFVKSGNLLLLR